MDRLDRAERKRKQAGSAKHICPQRQSPDNNLYTICAEASGRFHQFSTLQSDTSVQDFQDYWFTTGTLKANTQ